MKQAIIIGASSGIEHLAGISSIARFSGSVEGAVYAASKAFVSVYLDGLRDLARKRNVPVTVTELCPGFVDTALQVQCGYNRRPTNRSGWPHPKKPQYRCLAPSARARNARTSPAVGCWWRG